MNRFTDYLHNKIHKDQKQSKRIINVFNRVPHVMIDDKQEYDDFSLQIKDKEKMRTYLLKNLSLYILIQLHFVIQWKA